VSVAAFATSLLHPSPEGHVGTCRLQRGTTACCCEAVSALLWLEQVADCADLFPQGLTGSGNCLADQGFELRDGHPDRVQVWGTGCEEDQVVAFGAKQVARTR